MTQKITLRYLPMGKRGWSKGDLVKCIKTTPNGTEGDFVIAANDMAEWMKPYADNWQAQHLYATTDDVIRRGDLVYHSISDVIFKILSEDSNSQVKGANENCLKVIASTDPKCNLPSIPRHLKQAYAWNNGLNNCWEIEMFCSNGDFDHPKTYIPKLSGNEIVVSEKKTELIFKQPEDSNLKWVQDQHASGIIDKSFLEMGNPKQLNQSATDKAEAVVFAEWILKRRIIMTEVYEDGGFKDKWWLDKVAYTTEQLYSTFKQH